MRDSTLRRKLRRLVAALAPVASVGVCAGCTDGDTIAFDSGSPDHSTPPSCGPPNTTTIVVPPCVDGGVVDGGAPCYADASDASAPPPCAACPVMTNFA